MPKFVIERDIPGAGQLTERDLVAISKKSNRILDSLGPQIQWQHSYVADDKLFCVYIAPNEEMIREHARKGEFPVTRISQVRTIIDPTTGEK